MQEIVNWVLSLSGWIIDLINLIPDFILFTIFLAKRILIFGVILVILFFSPIIKDFAQEFNYEIIVGSLSFFGLKISSPSFGSSESSRNQKNYLINHRFFKVNISFQGGKGK